MTDRLAAALARANKALSSTGHTYRLDCAVALDNGSKRCRLYTTGRTLGCMTRWLSLPEAMRILAAYV